MMLKDGSDEVVEEELGVVLEAEVDEEVVVPSSNLE